MGLWGGGGRETDTGFWLGNLKERDYLEDPGVEEQVVPASKLTLNFEEIHIQII
jgi:hypothetical protein